MPSKGIIRPRGYKARLAICGNYINRHRLFHVQSSTRSGRIHVLNCCSGSSPRNCSMQSLQTDAIKGALLYSFLRVTWITGFVSAPCNAKRVKIIMETPDFIHKLMSKFRIKNKKYFSNIIQCLRRFFIRCGNI